MAEYAHPPRRGARRQVNSFGRLEEKVQSPNSTHDFVLSCEVIRKCGLIAEVVAENGYVTLYATRRVNKARAG